MCDPVSLTIASVAISAAGTVYGGVQAYQAGKEQEKQFKRQAALRQQKAQFDKAQAEQRFLRQRGLVLARAGTQGIDVSSISDVLADSAIESALEKKAIQFNANAERENLLAQGSAAARNGRGALIGSVFSAAGTAVSGAARMPQSSSATLSGWTPVVASNGTT